MRTPEGIVKDEVKRYLKSIGAYIFFPVQTGYGAATLDILCCVRGYFIGIECKRGDKIVQPSERQRKVINEIIECGGHAFVARSGKDVENFLKDHGIV